MKIAPIDIEALERERVPWNVYHIAEVMSDLISRQRGYRIDIVLTPKNLDAKGR